MKQIDPYELVVEPPLRRRVKPAVPVLHPPAEVITLPKQDAPSDEEKIVNRTMPLTILVAGIVIEITAAIFRASAAASALHAVTALALGVTGATVIMMLGMLVAARFRGIDLGSRGSALLKLAAIAIAPTALATLLTPAARLIPLGGIAILLLQFVAVFALLGAFFNLDEADTWYCVCVMFILNLGTYFALMSLGVGL